MVLYSIAQYYCLNKERLKIFYNFFETKFSMGLSISKNVLDMNSFCIPQLKTLSLCMGVANNLLQYVTSALGEMQT